MIHHKAALPAFILIHQNKRGAVDGCQFRSAQSGGRPFDKMRLAGAKRADQSDDLSPLQQGAEPPACFDRFLRGMGDDFDGLAGLHK